MPILKINHPPTNEELTLLTKEYPQYIKLSVDIDQKIVYGGGKLHYDCEQQLVLKENSKNKHIWSGGVNLTTKKIEYVAVANIKPSQDNPGLEILDPQIRQKFKKIVKSFFPNYE
jgi:hypothetical protein